MTRYRFLDGLGNVVAEGEFPDHASAVAAVDEVTDEGGDDVEIQRVEFLGPDGDWRWAGALGG